MKFSTKSRYGLRLMVELGMSFDQNLLQIKDISKKQELPEKYLEQIIIHLRNAGLVQSVRGAKGGYFLSRPPKEINLKEIVEALEGSVYPVECSENPETCKKSETCTTHGVWLKVGKAVKDVLESMTLEDLVEKHKNQQDINMFYI